MSSLSPEIGAVESIPEISYEEIRARLGDPSLVLVDVLPREAFAAGHIPGSIGLPVAEISERARRLLPASARAIVVYCASFT